MLASETLKRLMPRCDAVLYAPLLQAACERFEINTDLRVAAFLAQVAHESGECTRLVENLNYSADGLRKTWPRRFPTAESALPYARQPEKIANHVYCSRMGNGDESSGEGWKYRGRGLMQITGRALYVAAGNTLGINLAMEPDRAAEPEIACMTAAWVWWSKACNELADRGEFDAITHRINGGMNGAAERREYYRRAMMQAPSTPTPTHQPENEPVAPFLLAAIPSLISAIPEFAKIFSSPNVAERNVAAVSKAAELVTEAVGASNVQDAVEKIESDPQAAQAANDNLRASRAEIMDMIERMDAMEQKSIGSAREYNRSEQPVVGRWQFVHLISMVVVIGALAGIGYVLTTSTDATERAMALQALLLVGFGGVMAYWMGSSSGSKAKDEIMKGAAK